MVWTVDELLRLVRAWGESLNAPLPKTGGGKTKKKEEELSVSDLNKLIYRKFEALSGGSCNRSMQTVVARKDLLENSYDFIRDFLDNQQEMYGDVDWFSLSTSEQRTLMKTAGGTRVGPMEERVFLAIDKILAEQDESEAESVSSEATVADGYTSDGDKYQETIARKKKPAPKKKVSKKKAPPASSAKLKTSKVRGKSALEEETGELKEETTPKRRRVTSPTADPPSVKEIMEKQSEGLVGFMEKRSEERAKEQERGRKEREADQKFWAEQTEKDRALLRDLFMRD